MMLIGKFNNFFNGNIMKSIALFFILMIFVPLQAKANDLTKKYENLMRQDDKQVSSNENKVIEPVENKEPFSFTILTEKLSKRNFTDEQKNQIFFKYYLETGQNIESINLVNIINYDMPLKIKETLIKSKKLKFSSQIDMNTIISLRDFAKSKNCEQCIEDSYIIGNKEINIAFNVKKIQKYAAFDTYYFTPTEESSNNLLAFLDSKDDGVEFGIGDKIEANCNTDYEKENSSFIFWHCRLIKVGDVQVNKSYPQNVNKYKIISNCGSIKNIQEKLNYSGVNIGNPDGRFGGQLFFGLIAYQIQHNLPATGDIDTETCSSLKLISLPEPFDEKKILQPYLMR